MDRICACLVLVMFAAATPAAEPSGVPLWWPLERVSNDYQLYCERRLRRLLDHGWLQDPGKFPNETRLFHVDVPEFLRRSQTLFWMAQADYQKGRLRDADARLEDSIELIDKSTHGFALDLIPVLTAQARLDRLNGANGRAVERLRRARAIFRHATGLKAPCQGLWLEAEAEALAAAGDLMAADRARLLSHRLRRHPRTDQHQLQVDALIDLATWQRTLHASLPPGQRAGLSCLIASSFSPGIEEPRRCHEPGMRELYKRAVQLLEDKEGNDSLSLVEPLRGLAISYLYGTAHWEGYGDRVGFHGPYSRAKKTLLRALEIAEKAEIGASDVTVATILIDLGDWHSIYDHGPKRAHQYYRRAWALLTETDPGGDVPKPFEKPVRLLHLPAGFQNSRARGQFSDSGPMLPGWVNAELTVTADGRAEDITVIDNQPANWTRHNRDVERSIATSRFRPAWRNGRPVPARTEIRYSFRYPAPTIGLEPDSG